MIFPFEVNFRGSRLWSLIKKEFRQTMRNHLLLYLLIVPPTVQLIILAAALDPQLHKVSMSFCDQSKSALSRSFQDMFNASKVFRPLVVSDDPETSYRLLEHSDVSVAVVIPPDFEEKYEKERKISFQTLVDGTDAYTATVACTYLKQMAAHFEPDELAGSKVALALVETRMLYNPGLKSSWFIATGVLGALLTVVGTLVSSAVLLREKELGTLEQLLMSPASAAEIIIAKILPLLVLLMADLVAAVFLAKLIFALPLSGNLFVFLLGSLAYILSCIGFGMLLGTFCSSQRQAQLCSFFISIPLIQLSGSVVPFESMPEFLQMLSRLDPLRYFTLFVRASLLKGADFGVLLPQLSVLVFSAVLLLTISAVRFRRQLG